jgi:hypothetical protein
VVINYLDIDGSGGAFWPFETNPPLVIDADAELALSIALERFQPVAGQGGKVFQTCRDLQAVEPNFGLSPETGKLPNVLTTGKTFSSSVPVTQDHGEG